LRSGPTQGCRANGKMQWKKKKKKKKKKEEEEEEEEEVCCREVS